MEHTDGGEKMCVSHVMLLHQPPVHLCCLTHICKVSQVLNHVAFATVIETLQPPEGHLQPPIGHT